MVYPINEVLLVSADVGLYFVDILYILAYIS